MKIRMYKQVVELGEWQICGWDDKWCATKVIDNAEEVDFYRNEASKEDVGFGRGVYYSPRCGQFCITFKFIGEREMED